MKRELIYKDEAIEQIQIWAVNLSNPKMLSREDAVLVLENLPSVDHIGDSTEMVSDKDPHTATYIQALKNRIKELEADRPRGRWIPCSERLPAKAGHYLCSFKKPKRIDNIHVELAYWTGGRWHGYLAPEITAWMPLPEPWKGAGDD